jgi:hypothetical protein
MLGESLSRVPPAPVESIAVGAAIFTKCPFVVLDNVTDLGSDAFFPKRGLANHLASSQSRLRGEQKKEISAWHNERTSRDNLSTAFRE